VRNFMAAAFVLDAIAGTRSKQMPAAGGRPTPEIETDWNPAALAIRARRAMGSDELLRVRLHNGDAHIGRVARIEKAGPARRGTTLGLELDGGGPVHLADIAAIGPAGRRTRRRERRELRLAASAHAFGYRGHCLTKSRRYSTTFKQLRADREGWVHDQILARSRDQAQRALAGAVERIVALECDGVGHVTAADEYLATSEAARARERRRIGREECCGETKRAREATRRATGDELVLVGESNREAVHDG
jgi:hypothetical protein